jgi:ribosome maturation factor RimP
MKETLERIKDIIKEPMEKMNIIVSDVDYVTENNYHFLKITLDKVNGIDLDTIVEATNIINPILDEYDLIKEEYILDISSKERG